MKSKLCGHLYSNQYYDGKRKYFPILFNVLAEGGCAARVAGFSLCLLGFVVYRTLP